MLEVVVAHLGKELPRILSSPGFFYSAFLSSFPGNIVEGQIVSKMEYTLRLLYVFRRLQPSLAHEANQQVEE